MNIKVIALDAGQWKGQAIPTWRDSGKGE